MHTTFAPMIELRDRSLVGPWLVLDDVSSSSALMEQLIAYGAEASEIPLPRWPEVKIPLGPALVVGLVILGSSAALVISRTRSYAIARLHGRAFGWAMGRLLGSFVAVWAVSGLVLLGLSAAWGVLRYDGVGMWEWLAHAGYLGAVFFGFLILGVVSTLAAVWTVQLLNAIKGELPSRAIIIGSWVLKVGSLILALNALINSISLGMQAANRTDSLEAMRGMPGAHFIILGNALTEVDQTEMGKVIGSWLREQDRAGRVLLAAPQVSAVGTFVIVNQEYLHANPVKLIDGTAASAAIRDDAVTMLYPDQHAVELEHLLAEARDIVEFQSGGRDDFRIDSLAISSGIDLPLFGLPSEMVQVGQNETTWLRDPVILVVPPDLFDGYTSAASLGRLMVFDVDALHAQISEDPKLATYVVGVISVETRAAQFAVIAGQEFREAVFQAVLCVAIALIAGVSTAMVYGKLRANRIFVRHLHGRNPLRSYAPLIALEIIPAAAVLVWVPLRILSLRIDHEAMAALGPGAGEAPTLRLLDALPGTLIVLIVSGGMMLTLLWSHKRIIRHGISEA